jgi:endonuclease/exonuclease/phosphatase family metal-dependent hydrolase
MQRLRVLTLNIWAKHGPWPARAAAIRAGLASEQPDVIAFQEVIGFADGSTQLDELLGPGEPLAERYPGRAYGMACTLANERTFGNALLCRFPLVDRCTVALPNPLGREPRALLCCLIELPGALLPVFVTHLDWELDGSYARCQQVRFIADQIDLFVAAAHKRPGADVLPPLLTGDFNAEPDSDEIRFLTGLHALPGADGQPPRGVYFNDCYARSRARLRPGPSQGDPDEGGATFSRRNPFAARAHEPDRRLDYIFAALPDARGRGEPVRAWRCFRTPYRESEGPAQPGPSAGSGAGPGLKDVPAEGVLASDHYGVAVDLAI